jgi:hypothetical protein
MKHISSHTHGILDYATGILLILAPNLFGFNGAGVAAIIARIFGVVFIVQAQFTNFELGTFHLIPLRVHLFTDYLLSALLAASPWIFGFYKSPANIWVPHLVIGCIAFVITSMTRTQPRLIRLQRQA